MRKRDRNWTFTDILDALAAAALIAAVAILAVWMHVSGAEAETQIPEEYAGYCEEAGQAYGICPELLLAVMEEESGGDPDAVGAGRGSRADAGVPEVP